VGIEDIFMKGATKEGFFAILFVGLFIYQIREHRNHLNKAEERENRLISFLEDMKEQFASLTRQYERLSDDVEEIRKKMN
jgi:chromosome segregation ATPase